MAIKISHKEYIRKIKRILYNFDYHKNNKPNSQSSGLQNCEEITENIQLKKNYKNFNDI